MSGKLPNMSTTTFKSDSYGALKAHLGMTNRPFKNYFENLSTRCVEILRSVCSLTAVTITMRLVEGM